MSKNDRVLGLLLGSWFAKQGTGCSDLELRRSGRQFARRSRSRVSQKYFGLPYRRQMKLMLWLIASIGIHPPDGPEGYS
jgi:hypothetical protein